MRFLVCLRPFYGHLHPMAPTARALQDAGHEVVFSTAETFRPAVEDEGFRFEAAGRDPRIPLEDGERGASTRDWGEVVTRSKVDDLVVLAGAERPDVILREQTDFAALIAAEVLGVPCATLGPALFIPPRSWRQLQGERLDRIRADYGLPLDPQFERLHPYLYLDVAPPSWQLPEAVQVDVLHSISPVVLPKPDDRTWAPPDTGGRPLAYITLGTVYNRRPVLLQSLIDGAIDAGLDVVVTTGLDQDPQSLGLEGIPRATVHRWLPQLEVMPHCRLVIAHGGFSTVMGALAHGLALLVVPLGSDNPVHARRCRQLGVGLTLHLANTDAQAVREAVLRLQTEPQWKRAAQRLRAEMVQLPGPDHAAELLVRLGETQEPIPGATGRRRVSSRPHERTAVIVPTFGDPRLVHALLTDIAKEPSVEPVVVDNGGDYEPLGAERVLRPGSNLGWAGGCNHALQKLADDGYDAFVLLNSDTRLSPDFFAGLWEARLSTGAWLLGPVYDGVWAYQDTEHSGPAAQYRPQPVHRAVPFLDGTCLFLPRETVEEVGLLDAEAFPKHGWGVDFDYALRTRRAGGAVCATELAFLNHEGNATASLQGDGWQVGAWDEMVAGMRRKWGQAWPSLLRAPDGQAVIQPVGDDDAAENTCVFVLGAPRSGASVVTRLMNLLGVAPPAAEAEAELVRLNELLAGVDGWMPPVDPFELLGRAAAVDALADARSSFAEHAPHRPFLWRDPRNDFLLPFWSAALDARIVAVLVLRHPLEVAESARAKLGWSRNTCLAHWERSLRHALANLVGMPVLVTRYTDVLDDPVEWCRRVERFLSAEGVPLLVPSDGRVLAETVKPELRRQKVTDGDALSDEQRLLACLADELVGEHHAFPDVDLPPETPDLERALHGVSATTNGHSNGGVHRSRLTQEWAEWVFENRQQGLRDGELAAVLVEHGLSPDEARSELTRLANGWAEPGYRLANRASWNQLVELGATYTIPFGPEQFVRAREYLDVPLELPWGEIENVLCLAAAGGQQGPLFAALGKRVTVFDLSPSQLERDREVSDTYGFEIECIEGDMLDLSSLYDRGFDLVYQAVSTCYVEDPVSVYGEVARVLRDGGWYWAEHWNPVHMQLEDLGRWSGTGYRAVRHQREGGPVLFTDRDGTAPPGSCWHYIHSLEPLVGGLGDAGFVVEGFAERFRGDPSAPPGSDDHVCAFVPPLLAVLARLDAVPQ